MVFLNFRNFIYIYFFYFLLRVGQEWNETIIFVFRLSRPFPTYFGFKWSHNGIFFKFFPIFLEFSITRRVGKKRNDNFCFLSFPAFSILFSLWMKPQWYFFRFFPFFLEFSITCQVGTEQNNRFYFHSFSAFPPLFWLEMKP